MAQSFTTLRTARLQLVAPRSGIVLYVDLDGTLLKTDMLWESVLLLLRKEPWKLLILIVLATKNRARLKRYIAERVEIRPESLPFNKDFLAWLTLQHELGRELVLATASDELLARRIAGYLGIFVDVIASDGMNNLKGDNKLLRIKERDGVFDYAGNSLSDNIIWRGCAGAIPVCAPASVAAVLRKSGKITIEFPCDQRPLRVWARAIRIHQWAKNLLVLIPLLASHHIFHREYFLPALGIFWAFNFLASATYVFNDLLDLTSDREHPTKRFRALACGVVSIPEGVALASVLGIFGIALASLGGVAALGVSLAYVTASLVYSFCLKQLLLIDVFTLAGLYTLRIVAGSLVTGIVLSSWLASFSVFVFLSLGFSKRAAELLRRLKQDGDSMLTGRAYQRSDFEQINQFGVASGFAASLVLALYIGSDQVRLLYKEPNWLWFMIPLFLYWITRLWLIAHRGELNEDPVVFALTDRTTILLCVACFLIALLAAVGPHVSFMK